MLIVTEHKGDPYRATHKRVSTIREDYIHIQWDTGYIDMRMSSWEKLSKKKKDLILKLG